ncbi:MAG: FAD-dependent oxidoreductase [Candidatus Woesearchaeota archaeon]
MRVVIIGGGSAGTTCAFELRRSDKEVEILLIEKTSNTEYSSCALPYVLSGEIPSFDDIFIFKKKDYEENNIKLLQNSEVKAIDRDAKTLLLAHDKDVPYDYLVLATGSDSFVPPIQGLENANYTCLNTIEDAKKIHERMKSGRKSVVVGAGMVGVELAFSLASKGENVSLVEAKENILPALLDEAIAKDLEEYLKSNGIQLYSGERISEVTSDSVITDTQEISYEDLFICTGVRPDTSIGKETGLDVNKGILVDDHMRTSDKNIFACGDCVESYEANSGKRIFSQLGTTAVRQAKVIASNILGSSEKFPPVMNNTISKIGEFYIGAVGMTKRRTTELDIKTISAKYTASARSEYYPSEERITLQLLCDHSGKIIGGQIIGDAEVVGRLNMIALAIQKGVTVQELANLETCYNPASAPIFDPLTIVADLCLKKLQFVRR